MFFSSLGIWMFLSIFCKSRRGTLVTLENFPSLNIDCIFPARINDQVPHFPFGRRGAVSILPSRTTKRVSSLGSTRATNSVPRTPPYTIGGNYNKAWSLCHGFGNHKSRGPFTHSKENLSESFFRIINIFINGDCRSTTQDYLAQIIKSESRPAFTRSRNFIVLKQGWRQTNRISKFGVFMKLNYLSANSGCKPNIGGGYKIIFFRNSFWSIRLLLAGPREKA